MRSHTSAVLAQLGVLVSLGLVSAFLHTYAKLRLGIPGHSAVLWITPLLIGRCLAPMRAAGTAASTTTALGLYCLRGFSLRWPVLLSFGTYWAVGPALDFYVLLLDKLVGNPDRTRSVLAGPLGVVFLAVGGVVANYAHLASKVLLAVIRSHTPRFGLAPGLYEMATYLVFGLAAGILAFVLARPLLKRRGAQGKDAQRTG